MRDATMLLLVALILALGLGTVTLQNDNHVRSSHLAELQRECEMLEAATERLEMRVQAHVPGRPDETEESLHPGERSLDP